ATPVSPLTRATAAAAAVTAPTIAAASAALRKTAPEGAESREETTSDSDGTRHLNNPAAARSQWSYRSARGG
ncbi:MAG: hypothetical protein ACRD3Q_06785, partial [Terriglobales bacterium]